LKILASLLNPKVNSSKFGAKIINNTGIQTNKKRIIL